MSASSAEIPAGAPWLTPILAVFSLGLSGLAVPSPAAAQTVVQHDFEDGTTQGWVPRGTAVVTNTTEAANTGTHSLKTTGRTAGFNGPALNLLGVLSPGTVVPGHRRGPTRVGRAGDAAHRHGAADAERRLEPVRPRGRERGHRRDRRRVGDAAGLLQLRRRRERAPALRREREPDRLLLRRRLQCRGRPRRRCAVPQDTTGIHTNFETGTPAGLGPAHRPRDGHGHECGRARRQLQPAHHRPTGGVRRRRDQRGRQAVQRLALRREPVGQAGAGAADVAAEGQHPAHASTASPTSTPSSRTRR